MPILSNRPLHWAIGLSVVFLLSGLLPPMPLFSVPEHYLALHTALEFFSIAVAGMVFALGWNLRRMVTGGRLVWLGAVFLAVGLIDLGHTLSYPGMPVFVTQNDADKAIQFWLMARLVMALGLLGFAFMAEQRWSGARAKGVTTVALVLAVLWAWIVLAHQDRMPRTFIDGQGMTDFKVWAQWH